jgi:23S rRNA (guanosine2251-2'-O)-methyltransferase
MSNKILFGFHAVTVRLKTTPKSVVEIHIDTSRRDQRMRQFIERCTVAGSKLIDAGDPEIEDKDGSRSDIGSKGGPGGGW